MKIDEYFKNDWSRKKRQEFDQEISEIENFAGNNGISSNSESFIAINVSYVTKDFHLETKILVILEMPKDKNAANYRRKVNAAEKNHGIAGDDENTMQSVFVKH